MKLNNPRKKTQNQTTNPQHLCHCYLFRFSVEVNQTLRFVYHLVSLPFCFSRRGDKLASTGKWHSQGEHLHMLCRWAKSNPCLWWVIIRLKHLSSGPAQGMWVLLRWCRAVFFITPGRRRYPEVYSEGHQFRLQFKKCVMSHSILFFLCSPCLV